MHSLGSCGVSEPCQPTAMASAAFLRRLASLTEFLACNKAMGRFLDHEDVRRVTDKAIEEMAGDIFNGNISLAESSVVLQKLTDADLPDNFNVQLHDIVNQRSDHGGCIDVTSKTGERTFQQKHNCVQNFPTAREWQILHTGGIGLAHQDPSQSLCPYWAAACE